VHVLALRRPSDLLLVDALGPEQADAFDALVGRRADRVPLQHLTGSVGFRHLELEVGPGVFVPRPETESVVQWAVDALRAEGRTAPLCVDLCTGSGAIALALADEVPGATVHAVERDPDALAWPAATPPAACRPATGGAPAPRQRRGRPARASTARSTSSSATLPTSRRPRRTSPSRRSSTTTPASPCGRGRTGWTSSGSSSRRLGGCCSPGGLVVVEHSDRQGRTVPALFAQAGGWSQVQDHADLAGRDRYVTARWAG
jgi:release factor glutamine methyltransferase